MLAAPSGAKPLQLAELIGAVAELGGRDRRG
jgi:hypothetical protein